MVGTSQAPDEAALTVIKKVAGDERLDRAERQLLCKFVESLKVSAAVPHKLAVRTTTDDAAEICGLDEVDSPYAVAFTHGSRQNSTIRRNGSAALSKLGSFMGRAGSISTERSVNGDFITMQLNIQDPEVQQLLEQIHRWGFDIDGLDKATNGRPLTHLFIAALQQLNLVEEFNLQQDKLLHFIMDVERQYPDNPFHNRKHAAEVVQAVASALLTDLKDKFTPLEQLILVVAAAVHDIGHPGLTNDYLENTLSEAAITYSGVSVNEQYHAAAATRTLLKEENNFLMPPANVTLQDIRPAVNQALLGTDIKHHAHGLKSFNAAIDKFGPDLATWPSDKNPTVATARMEVIVFIVHVADVCNVMKPRGQAAASASRFMQECQEQGNKERTLGLTVSPLNERPGDLPRSQKVFIEVFGKPCAEALARIAPITGRQAVANCEANLAYWKELMDQGVTFL